MNFQERIQLLRYIASECSKDPTLPSDIYKAITDGLVQGLQKEQEKSTSLGFSLVVLISAAQDNKALQNFISKHKHEMQKGLIHLANLFQSAPIEKEIRKYLE